MATRHNFAVIIKETRKAQGKGWQVVKIIDTKETTCCGYAIPWLKNNSVDYWYNGIFDISECDRPARPCYVSDKNCHQIYRFRNRWNVVHDVFFTKYPENYVNCHLPGDPRRFFPVDSWHNLNQYEGYFFLTEMSASYQRKQQEKALMEKKELLIRLDEVQQNLNNVESRKNELLAQLKKFG